MASFYMNEGVCLEDNHEKNQKKHEHLLFFSKRSVTFAAKMKEKDMTTIVSTYAYCYYYHYVL